MVVEFVVNGETRRVECHPLVRLLDVLRDDLRLTGTKEGCGEGECGACSVLVDGELVCACLIPAAQVRGAEVVTVEGAGLTGAGAARIQDALARFGGAQCGICTPGMVMAAYDFLRRADREGFEVDEDAIREAIAGNLCRCTGYVKIVDAVAAAWRESRSDTGDPAS